MAKNVSKGGFNPVKPFTDMGRRTVDANGDTVVFYLYKNGEEVGIYDTVSEVYDRLSSLKRPGSRDYSAKFEIKPVGKDS